jgi:hypothetical protein
VLVAGRRHHETHTLEVARLERTGAHLGESGGVDVRTDVGGDEANTGPGIRETLGLPSADATPTDHENRDIVQVEEHRVGEPRSRVVGHVDECRKVIPYKVDLFGRD